MMPSWNGRRKAGAIPTSLASEHRSSRRRSVAALLACAFALLAPIGVAWAATTNYVDSATFNDLDWGQTPGTANRTYNELWRPSGYNFKLFYSNDTTGKSGTGNPLLDPRNWASAHAACQNQSGWNNISPVTCQTDGA
jgi:hypothetical protein